VHHNRETDLDDVLQISNVFVNVSKGEVAKSNDLKKSFGTDDRSTIAREVSGTAPITQQKSDFPALAITDPHER
jgi:ribosome maturation protein SDO1